MIIDNRKENPNRDKAFIYTEECRLCGKTKKYDFLIKQFQEKGYKTIVKQIPLFDGWRKEANMISESLDLKIPFVWFFNTRKGKTIEDARKTGIDDLLQ